MEEYHHASSSSQSHQQHTSSTIIPSQHVWRYHHHPDGSDRNNQLECTQEVKHITEYASHQSHRVADSTITPLMGTLLPPRGWPGMRVFVYLPISFLQNGRHLKLAFSRIVVDTQLTYARDVVTLTAFVPDLDYAQAPSNAVHVTLCLIDGQNVRDHWDLGEFVYEQQPRLFSESWSTLSYSFASIVSHEESLVSHSCNNDNNSAVAHDIRTSSGGGYYTLGSNLSPLHSTYDDKGSSSSNSILSSRPQHFRVEPHQVVAPTQVLHRHPDPYSHQSRKRRKRRPEMNISTTSQGTSAHITPPTVPYEFYLSLPLTVGFEMLNNFDDILENWSEKEVRESRRVVWFWRVNSISDIKQQQEQRITNPNHVVVYCKCAPVNIQLPVMSNEDGSLERKGALVSCIAWEGEHYVTSVDMINILQEMLNKSFTVHSKNRIRRNLEEFKPITASKYKPETVGLFRLIMGLSHPQPRNIEKDIKVFYWRTLPVALRKVIDKYFIESLSTRISQHNVSNNDPPLSRSTSSFPRRTTTSRTITTASSTRHYQESTSLDENNKDTKSKDTHE